MEYLWENYGNHIWEGLGRSESSDCPDTGDQKFQIATYSIAVYLLFINKGTGKVSKGKIWGIPPPVPDGTKRWDEAPGRSAGTKRMMKSVTIV